MGTQSFGVLPLSPDIDRWTEEHYYLYGLVEFVLGNRKEVTPEDLKDMEIAQKADELVESGDPDWLQKVQELMGEEGFSDFDIDNELFSEINEEQLRRGE